MSSQNQTRIVAQMGKQEIYIIREFDAPREVVFNAHTNPEILMQWLGPEGRVMKIDKYDSRSGGSYRYFMCNEQGKAIAAFNGVMHEVTAPERVIQTSEFEGLSERGHVALGTTIFEELPGNRTKVTTHSVFRSIFDRDTTLQSGMEKGLNEGYRKLDALLAKQ
jgi:uncharacterized protein YndB with AHSA1/START domain